MKLQAGCCVVALMAGTGFSPGVALALQEMALEEVLVTAQRRSESLEDVPISVSAFGSRMLEAPGIEDAADLTGFTPGFNGDAVSASQPLLTMRGVGSNDFTIGNDPALGVYIDEVYVGRSAGALVDLFDAARVEVLKGPQGTLFGRNTTGGALSITRNQPRDEREGNIEGRVGNDDYTDIRLVYNQPLTDDLYSRFAFQKRDRDGYVEDVLTRNDLVDTDLTSAKGALKYEGNHSDYTVTFDWTENDQDAAVYRSLLDLPGIGRLDERKAATDIPGEQHNKRNVYMLSGIGNWEIGPDLELKSITGWRKYKVDYLEDTDATPLRLLHFGTNEKSEVYSQEFRLNGSAERIDWFFGVSVYYEDINALSSVDYSEAVICMFEIGSTCEPIIGEPGSNVQERNNASGDYWNYAAFGDLQYSINERTRLTVGLRYSYDDKKLDAENPVPENAVLGPTLNALGLLPESNFFLLETDGLISQQDDWSEWQPRLVLDYSPDDDTMVYASATMGYKSGGFNVLVPAAGSFDPETMYSYETGIKGSLLDRRLTYSASGFYYKYDDLQVQIVEEVTITRNAAKAAGYGFESTVSYLPIESLTLTGTFAWLHAEYDKFQPEPGKDFGGNDLARAPEWTGSLRADYSRPLGEGYRMDFGLWAVYTGRQYLLAGNQPASRQDDYTIINAELGLSTSDDKYYGALFVTNATDEEYVTQTQIIDSFGLELVQDAPPRYYGIKLGYRF